MPKERARKANQRNAQDGRRKATKKERDGGEAIVPNGRQSLSFFSLLSSLLSSLPLFLLSSLLATAANFEAFEFDLAHGKCTSVGSLPPPFSHPSSLLSLLSSKKKGGNFALQEYFRRRIYFYYGFKLNQKNRRRGKLQALRLHINSKTIGL